jgi:hypothetical protein
MNKRRFLQLGATLLLAGACLWLLFLATSPARAQGPVLLDPNPGWFSGVGDYHTSLAWGDVDGDGDLDLAVGSAAAPNRVYLNVGGVLTTTNPWTSDEAHATSSVAWGDVDGDGDLDLAVGNVGWFDRPQHNEVYLNVGGRLERIASWTSGDEDWTNSVAWGDVDGDGDLDLAVGNMGYFDGGWDTWYPDIGVRNKVYLNVGGVLTTTNLWISNEADPTQSVAWGDVDGDGDLDLAVGNSCEKRSQYSDRLTCYPSRVYCNDTIKDGFPNPAATDETRLVLAWSSPEHDNNDNTRSVAWGDVDGDGDLDLAVGNDGQPNKVYLNVNGVLTTTNPWTSGDTDLTKSVAWGDVDGDGDLDLAAGNGTLGSAQVNKVYLNEGGELEETASWTSLDQDVTRSVAWGDMDGDGDLDLAAGNYGAEGKVYLNRGVSLTYAWTGEESGGTNSVAWGDADGDGDLDLAVGGGQSGWQCSGSHSQDRVYLNEEGGLQGQADWTSQGETDWTSSVAWGDVDGDGDLDLATGNGLLEGLWESWSCTATNKVYLNEEGELEKTASWTSLDRDVTMSVAWGDVDADGDLDLAVGNYEAQNKVYLNQGEVLERTAWWTSPDTDKTYSVAWGDVDGDGDLDLAAGNHGENKVYLNVGGDLQTPAAWTSGDADWTWSVAWGDVDGDGDLDLAAGNSGRPNIGAPTKVYTNAGGELQRTAAWTSGDVEPTRSVAWGDVDGDGDLDLAAASNAGSTRVYLNVEGRLQTTPTWKYGCGYARSVAWGDMDGDGNLDLAVGGVSQDPMVFTHPQFAHPLHPGQTASVALGLSSDPVSTFLSRTSTALAPADFYAVPGIRQSGTIPITYTLFDPTGDPVPYIQGFYSPDGGGKWFTATATSDTITRNLATSTYPTEITNTHVFTWDVFASGFFGHSDNMVLRLKAYPVSCCDGVTGTYRYTNTIPGPYQRPYVAAQTFPFRVRGTQVRVISDTVTGTVPMPNAIVYRLREGQTGTLMVDGAGNAFRTNQDGYLQGWGQIGIGDRLLALAPVPVPLTYTERYSDAMRLYYTNGTPTEDGLETWISSSKTPTVTQSGVQTLTVSAEHPLILFDLDVSLEWDASNEPTYLDQLEFDLKQASKHLYDFTDGQVALGKVTVYQNADNWAFTHVDVHATNRLRPFATIGGMVLTDTIDPGGRPITYSIGQVNMGSTWNRYGNPGQSLGEDWPLALAHELSHFLLFLEDTYLGLKDDLLIAVDSCTGSAMGDTYAVDNTEFVFDDEHWEDNCSQTLAGKTLSRTEWVNIECWYPWLKTPSTIISGPSVMPFELTTVERAPMTHTKALEDPTFYLNYGGEVGSSGARAFLLRNGDKTLDGFEYVYDLGSPVGGQNRLLARGAQPGDRLCVFDQARRQYGCEVIEPGDEQLVLKKDKSWTPVIQISPVHSTTFTIQVSAVPELTGPLKARLYPEFGFGFPETTLDFVDGVYSGTLQLDYPALVGDVQVWVEETAVELDPRREVIVAYSIGGNPTNVRGGGTNVRGGGTNIRGGGTNIRGGGTNVRGGGAPLVSPDGQMIFFTADPIPLAEGQFYTVQDMAGLPPLPQGKKAIGQGYNLFATPETPLAGSISFQYLGTDALTEGLNEEGERGLTIHYWNGEQGWQALVTRTDSKYNLASAPSQKEPGVYALLAGPTEPVITACSPSVATKGVTATLTLTGENFLPPVQVELVGSNTYTLPAHIASTATVTAEILPGPDWPAQEYDLVVVNKDQGRVLAPCTLGVFEPESEDVCFYDLFESGAGKWEPDGDWGVVSITPTQSITPILAMTDSPIGPYKSAGDYGSGVIAHTTSMTTAAFDLTGCTDPVLTFRHDYVIAQGPTHQDMARVEISADGGATWNELASYSGGGIFGEGPGAQDVESPEWADVKWKKAWIRLDAYTGTVRLRFSLAVDQNVSDKGWVIDKVMAQSGHHAFLPLILKNE